MKYSRNFLRAFEKALIEIKDGPPYPRTGICKNVERCLPAKYIWGDVGGELLLVSLFRLWPKYSGMCGYPVPFNGGVISAYINEPLWDCSTQYGRNRWELLDFLLEQVQAMIREIDEYIEEHELEYLEGYK